LKDSKIGLALIWRYFFESFLFRRNLNLEKRNFQTFLMWLVFRKKRMTQRRKKDLFAGNREMWNLFDVFAFNANPSPPAGRAYVMPGGLFFFPDLCYTE